MTQQPQSPPDEFSPIPQNLNQNSPRSSERDLILTFATPLIVQNLMVFSGIARGRAGGVYNDPRTFGYWVGGVCLTPKVLIVAESQLASRTECVPAK